MRTLTLVILAGLALAGCDDAKPAADAGALTSSAAPSASAAEVPSAAPSVSAAAVSKRPMPPRPVPVGSSGPIQPSAPPEQQVMAIQYTIAMLSPGPTDPLVEKSFVDDLVKKLEVAVRTADKGKTPPNPVKAEKGDRKIVIEMGKGCTDRLPANLVAQRANSSLRAAYENGVLVVMCHDNKWECHQSTRDPDDVLCLAAPRH
ncbi:MAG TPA: hypothetical protein VF316_21940 [Polyangiaceae bacterium]